MSHTTMMRARVRTDVANPAVMLRVDELMALVADDLAQPETDPLVLLEEAQAAIEDEPVLCRYFREDGDCPHDGCVEARMLRQVTTDGLASARRLINLGWNADGVLEVTLVAVREVPAICHVRRAEGACSHPGCVEALRLRALAAGRFARIQHAQRLAVDDDVEQQAA